ncbi:dicarboxylate/amino acid:cation symporter [Moraxella sp. ZY210820]|uniref:dicarboxylate/amino acid:cation symporter n=1 Tax=unclassified Moraxella TaxID=2685852 RepID=UPI00272F1CEC|nr:dicarboxylate/amino acid:cation symporter [Moraxella sp. ZY210820]WLF83053.1 dicarboxylate/amino acid:cation symporter [Moraxella sp. ZY210820]
MVVKKAPFYKALYFWVVVAIIAGILLGHFAPKVGASLEPLGKAFIQLVKMIIAPVIFLTIVTGIAGMNNMKTVGRVATKAMIYFLTFSTLALIIGLVVGNVIQPGAGMNINPETIAKGAAKVTEYGEKAQKSGVVEFLMAIIPNTLVSPLVGNNILQVLFVSVLFGYALSKSGEAGRPITEFLQQLAEPIFIIVNLIMKLAPIGAFGAMAFTIGKYGLSSLTSLMTLIATFYITSLLFVFIVLGAVAKYNGFSIFKMIRYIKEELWLVLGTSSSEAALPTLMKKMEKAGCEKSVVGLVIPTGYSFNLDGTNIYMTMAALFIAQAYGIDLTLFEQITLLLVAMVSSKGAAGVTGAGFITLAATIQMVPSIPLEGMALILGIDRFMSECRALTNLVGNACATIVVARWEDALDKEQLDKAFAGQLDDNLPPPVAPAT